MAELTPEGKARRKGKRLEKRARKLAKRAWLQHERKQPQTEPELIIAYLTNGEYIIRTKTVADRRKYLAAGYRRMTRREFRKYAVVDVDPV